MKTAAISVLAMLNSLWAFSQDTLYTKKGEVLNANVIEINQDQVKFKKTSNPDGPLYVVNKSEILSIRYENGSREIFSTATTSSSDANTITGQNNASSGNSPNVINNNYSTYPGYSRPRVNVVIGAGMPFGYGSWGYGNYYRSNYYHRSGNFYGGGYHCGHYGRRR